MIEHEEDGIWISIEETIAIHHEEVFACLTSPGGLMRWFSVDAEVDLRQGGLIKFIWDREKKRTTTIAILDYHTDGRIVWDWQIAMQDRHAPVYWKVEPHVEEGSQVTLRQGPFADDQESLMAMAQEAITWRWYLCNLRGILEAKHDMRAVRPL